MSIEWISVDHGGKLPKGEVLCHSRGDYLVGYIGEDLVCTGDGCAMGLVTHYAYITPPEGA